MTEIIVMERGAGKTSKAIRIASETFSYIVCLDSGEADRVAKQARKMGLDIPYPITYGEFLGGNFNPHGVKGFVIDNADMLLMEVIGRSARGRPINAITMSPM